MKLSFEMKTETDCEIDFYNEKTLEMERWFVEADDIRHIVSLIKEEFGDPAYTMDNYF